MGVLVYLLILVLVFGLIAFLIRNAPIEENFKTIGLYVLLVIFVIFIIGFLTGIVPIGPTMFDSSPHTVPVR